MTQVDVGYSNTEYGRTDKGKMVVLFRDVTFCVVVGECGNCDAEGLCGFASELRPPKQGIRYGYVDKDSRLGMLNDEVM